MVDASLLKEVDDRIKAVREKSADRLLRLAYENSRSKILVLLEAGRKQLNCQPVKYASQAHVEKALREYTVCTQCTVIKISVLRTVLKTPLTSFGILIIFIRSVRNVVSGNTLRYFVALTLTMVRLISDRLISRVAGGCIVV